MEQVKKRVLYGILILVTLFIYRIAWLDVGTGEKIFAFLGQCATGIPGLTLQALGSVPINAE